MAAISVSSLFMAGVLQINFSILVLALAQSNDAENEGTAAAHDATKINIVSALVLISLVIF